jgi:Cu-Zn family superoxide dismutase
MEGRAMTLSATCFRRIALLVPVLSAGLLGACSSSPPPGAESGKPGSTRFEVPIEAKSGSSLVGKAMFSEVSGGVEVKIEVSGAPPGKIATHVHEKGDCSAADGTSAGDHFNPASNPHGLPPDQTRHLGDLGNIEIKADGTGSTDVVVKGASLEMKDPNSFLNRALIVHAKQDDGGQPTGNAGGRIGCAVIMPRTRP